MAEYIEKEAAINELRETHKRFYTPPSEPMCFSDVIGVIKNVPAADVVERKRGRWEPVIGEYDSCYCSCCIKKYTGFFACGWNFCPNCGADMR